MVPGLDEQAKPRILNQVKEQNASFKEQTTLDSVRKKKVNFT
jgi:hypothetical protein